MRKFTLRKYLKRRCGFVYVYIYYIYMYKYMGLR